MICLFETHAEKSNEKIWSAEWGSPIFFANNTSRSAGVAILFNKKRNVQILDANFDSEGRYVNDINFALAAIYAPNVNSEAFFENVFVNLIIWKYTIK